MRAQAGGKGSCWSQQAGANAASAGDESDEGGPGEGSSAGATCISECTSAEPVSGGSGGSSGQGGSGSDESHVQVGFLELAVLFVHASAGLHACCEPVLLPCKQWEVKHGSVVLNRTA